MGGAYGGLGAGHIVLCTLALHKAVAANVNLAIGQRSTVIGLAVTGGGQGHIPLGDVHIVHDFRKGVVPRVGTGQGQFSHGDGLAVARVGILDRAGGHASDDDIVTGDHAGRLTHLNLNNIRTVIHPVNGGDGDRQLPRGNVGLVSQGQVRSQGVVAGSSTAQSQVAGSDGLVVGYILVRKGHGAGRDRQAFDGGLKAHRAGSRGVAVIDLIIGSEGQVIRRQGLAGDGQLAGGDSNCVVVVRGIGGRDGNVVAHIFLTLIPSRAGIRNDQIILAIEACYRTGKGGIILTILLGLAIHRDGNGSRSDGQCTGNQVHGVLICHIVTIGILDDRSAGDGDRIPRRIHILTGAAGRQAFHSVTLRQAGHSIARHGLGITVIGLAITVGSDGDRTLGGKLRIVGHRAGAVRLGGHIVSVGRKRSTCALGIVIPAHEVVASAGCGGRALDSAGGQVNGLGGEGDAAAFLGHIVDGGSLLGPHRVEGDASASGGQICGHLILVSVHNPAIKIGGPALEGVVGTAERIGVKLTACTAGEDLVRHDAGGVRGVLIILHGVGVRDVVDVDDAVCLDGSGDGASCFGIKPVSRILVGSIDLPSINRDHIAADPHILRNCILIRSRAVLVILDVVGQLTGLRGILHKHHVHHIVARAGNSGVFRGNRTERVAHKGTGNSHVIRDQCPFLSTVAGAVHQVPRSHAVLIVVHRVGVGRSGHVDCGIADRALTKGDPLVVLLAAVEAQRHVRVGIQRAVVARLGLHL